MGNSENDKFLRKIIWYLGGITLTSAIAISAMQVQINGNSKAVEEIRETNRALNKISITLQSVLDSGEYRNKLLIAQAKRQDKLDFRQINILSEQQKRTSIVYDSARHMRNRRIHK